MTDDEIVARQMNDDAGNNAIGPGHVNVPIAATPDVWRAIIAVMMEAPVPGKVVVPLANVIQQALVAAGHQP